MFANDKRKRFARSYQIYRSCITRVSIVRREEEKKKEIVEIRHTKFIISQRVPRIELTCSLRSSNSVFSGLPGVCTGTLVLVSGGWGLVLSAPQLGPPNVERLPSIYVPHYGVSFKKSARQRSSRVYNIYSFSRFFHDRLGLYLF